MTTTRYSDSLGKTGFSVRKNFDDKMSKTIYNFKDDEN